VVVFSTTMDLKVVEIVPNDTNGASFKNFLTEDRTFLHLSYPGLDDGIEGYNNFFDWLDQSDHTYDTVKRLTIETDFIYSLPAGVSKFQNLAKLVVSGSRFWDFTCELVPTSVTHLDLTDHSNLQPKCIKGMDRLVNLCELKLDWTPFGFNGLFFWEEIDVTEIHIPIPDHPSLASIWFRSGIYARFSDLRDDWQKIFFSLPLFDKIRHRIAQIDEYDDVGTGLHIVLA